MAGNSYLTLRASIESIDKSTPKLTSFAQPNSLAKTWNGAGHGGEGTAGNGYPYNISPDVPKTISVVPGIGILIGTTDGEFILKGFGN